MLTIAREQYVLKFLPKFLKNSSVAAQIGKEGRLCSPRFLFFFERTLPGYRNLDALQKYEFEIEDGIYKMLRNEFVITNNRYRLKMALAKCNVTRGIDSFSF